MHPRSKVHKLCLELIARFLYYNNSYLSMEDLAKTISNMDIFSLRINQVLDFLKTKSIMLEKLNAIEIFGGTGQNDVAVAVSVKTFEIWEIDGKLKPELEKKFPNAKIEICNSVDRLNQYQNTSKFDLIMIDNPISVFGAGKNSSEYCEHFDMIKNVGKLIDKEAIVIFLINKKPFFFNKLKKKNELWRKRRQEFYGNINTNNMSIPFLTSFYTELFRNMGLTTIFTNSIPRHNPHLDYFIFMLRKNDIQYGDSPKTFDWISLDPLFSRNQ